MYFWRGDDKHVYYWKGLTMLWVSADESNWTIEC